MAWTARHGDDLVEFEEQESVLNEHCQQLAAMIKKAKHFVAYTGAGISCSAGIPDFRGPQGVWTLKAQGKQAVAKVSTLQAVPTLAHMSLVKLQNEGVLRHLISSNCDGLHVKSGIKPDMITEVHGNSNREECEACGKSYYRDFATRCNDNVALAARLKLTGRAAQHFTGRFCLCGGVLTDSIINFGENLSEAALKSGFHNGSSADLMVAMGASLTVSPSCDMVKAAKKKGKLVIINLQKTPYDDICDLRIFAKTDAVWSRVMKFLGYEIPPFQINRRVALWKEDNGMIKSVGIAFDNTPNTWIKTVVHVRNNEIVDTFEATPGALQCHSFRAPPVGCDVALLSFGHYGEAPCVVLSSKVDLPTVLFMTYTPGNGSWDVRPEQGDAKAIVASLAQLKDQPQQRGNVQPERKQQQVEENVGFAVYPKTDCEHCAEINLDKVVVDAFAKCGVCKDGSENWLCLKCSHVACSRYVNSHMVEHAKGCNSAILASYADLSFWCVKCDSYVTHPSLKLLKRAMELSKFGK